MSHRSISIVLPIYNHAHFLPRALKAIAAQEAAPGEIIIVDDASTDASADVAESLRYLLEPASSVTILRNQENLGVNRSLNRGLSEAKGAYVACTAADDWLEPAYVSSMARVISRFPGTKIATGGYVEFFEADGRRIEHGPKSESGPWYAGCEDARFDADGLRGLLSRGPVALPVSASLIETETLRQMGGFDPALKWHADWFVANAIALRHGFAVAPQTLSVFRVASGTYSGDNVNHGARQRAVCHAILDKLCTSEFNDIRSTLLRAPAPFAPIARHIAPAAATRPQDQDLFLALLRWWVREVARGRRPGHLHRVVQSLGFDVVPRRA